jgi:hypothetical protein
MTTKLTKKSFTILLSNQPGSIAYAVFSANWRVDFQHGRLVKYSFITLDEMKARSYDQGFKSSKNHLFSLLYLLQVNNFFGFSFVKKY